jgi:hypothetical protein
VSETTDKASLQRRRWQGIRVAIVSGLFVLTGVALRDEVPWYATAFFAVCLVFGVLSIFGIPRERRAQSLQQLTIDDTGITRTARKLREHVAWQDIKRVQIMTNDRGPWLEDVFFILDSKKGGGCVVPHDLAVSGRLLEALQERLEGLNNGAVIEAMTSIENRTFTIWEAETNS